MNKKILITGASTGIGAATSKLLAKNNLIFIHYNSSEGPAKEVSQEVQAAGGKAILIQADLTTEEGCISLINNVKKHTDSLDVLINNAGGLVERRAIAKIDWDLMNRLFSLNTFSLIKLTGLCVPLLMNGVSPCVVNISSIVARHGAAGATLYGAAKGAVDVFTRGAAKELAPTIRVNSVAPGVIDTPFHDKVSTPEQMENWKEACPLKINGSANDIATTVQFIIENKFLTGESIDVNGGSFMR